MAYLPYQPVSQISFINSTAHLGYAMGPWVFDAKEGARADATEALSSTDLTQAATKKVRPLFFRLFLAGFPLPKTNRTECFGGRSWGRL